MENPIKMDDLGITLFLGNTHINISPNIFFHKEPPIQSPYPHSLSTSPSHGSSQVAGRKADEPRGDLNLIKPNFDSLHQFLCN